MKSVILDHTKKSPYIEELERFLNERVIGQKQAVSEICDSFSRILGDNPNRKGTIGNFLFLGSTGVGKTELYRALNEFLYGDNIDYNNNKIDCNQMQLAHEISTKLLGAPASYVDGDLIPKFADISLDKAYNIARENNTLHPLIKNLNSFRIVLFDEFEKAHENLSRLLLSVMDEGKIELQRGNIGNEKNKKYEYSKTTEFKNTIFIFTSNLGAKEIQDILNGKSKEVGFKQTSEKKSVIPREFYEMKMKESFAPEFINRITEFIAFNSLNEESLRLILELTIENSNKNYEHTGVKIILRKELKNFLLHKAEESNMGARNLVKQFDKMVITNYNRVLNNGTIKQMEDINTQSITGLIFNINNKEEISVRGQFGKNENKKPKIKKSSIKRELYQDEVIVSLQDNSLIYTLRDNIMPSIQYLNALYQEKNKFSTSFDSEIELYENQLLTWGLTQKDIDLIRESTIESKLIGFEEFYGHMKGVRLWNKEEFNINFNGKTRYIEKYMRRFFETNNDIKKLIENDAGTKSEVLAPIYLFARKLVEGRQLTNEEDNIIAAIFHREYLKLKSDSKQDKIANDKISTSKDSQEKNNKPDVTKNKEVDKKSTTEINSGAVNININLNGEKTDITSWIDTLENVFSDDFHKVLNSIKKHTVLSEDIIDVLINVKEELNKKLKPEQSAALNKAANEIWDNPEKYIEIEFEAIISLGDKFDNVRELIVSYLDKTEHVSDFLNQIDMNIYKSGYNISEEEKYVVEKYAINLFYKVKKDDLIAYL